MCQPTFINCTISGNSAHGGGGLGCMFSSGPTLINCVMSGNQGDYGGALYAGAWAGLSAFNCTITGNSATEDGGAVSCMEGGATMRNCILWNNEPEEMGGYCGMPVTYCDIDGGWPGEGNIDADPLFVDPANEDFHLSACSPCIDAADNDAVPLGVNTDFDGNPRIIDGDEDGTTTVDMGAYEFTLLGDLDADCDVDLSDLAALLASYNECVGDPHYNLAADLDCDGCVELEDLAALLSVYGTSCP